MAIKAYFKGVEFDLYGEPNKEIAQAELLYLNSLGDPVFTKEGTCFEAENDINNVDISEVGFWFTRLCEVESEEQGAEFGIYENGLEVFGA